LAINDALLRAAVRWSDLHDMLRTKPNCVFTPP
jgi:hypothetical protein